MKFALPKIIRADFARKLVALFFAAVLWIYVNIQLHETQTYHDIPMNFTFDPNTTMVERDVIPVTVTLRGSRSRLDKIRNADIKATATLPPVIKGVYFTSVNFTPDNISCPLGTVVTNIQPQHVSLAVDRIEPKSAVPVRVRYSGKLREGYQVQTCSIVPSLVDIRGTSKLLQEIKELVTEEVPLDEAVTHGFEMEARLAPIFNVTPSIEKVHIEVKIARQVVEQAYSDLPLRLLRAPAQPLELLQPLPTIAVTLQGPQANIDSIDAATLRPFVDVSDITIPGRHRRPVQVWAGGLANVSVEYVFPTMVDIVLGEHPAAKDAPPPKTPKP